MRQYVARYLWQAPYIDQKRALQTPAASRRRVRELQKELIDYHASASEQEESEGEPSGEPSGARCGSEELGEDEDEDEEQPVGRAARRPEQKKKLKEGLCALVDLVFDE
ncbi:hypothetical protein FJTKL_04827 [Diaporthe vaccinii]|uniref:Uncharacterized protein n=1 Tax=Diaporthe vaccinii TaxID=105482 RepID=A0ABR4DVP7_9PEZI